MKRFHELFDSIGEFLEEYHSTLVEEVKRVRIDVAYLAVISEKLNTLNLQLQGNNITNLIQAHGIVLSFLCKLTMFRQNIARREFGHFTCMRQLDVNDNITITDDKLQIYCLHVESLRDYMLIRFKDLTELVIPTWVINLFGTNIETVDMHLQEEFIDLQNDIECSAIFPQIGYKYHIMHFGLETKYLRIIHTYIRH